MSKQINIVRVIADVLPSNIAIGFDMVVVRMQEHPDFDTQWTEEVIRITLEELIDSGKIRRRNNGYMLNGIQSK